MCMHIYLRWVYAHSCGHQHAGPQWKPALESGRPREAARLGSSHGRRSERVAERPRFIQVTRYTFIAWHPKPAVFVSETQ